MMNTCPAFTELFQQTTKGVSLTQDIRDKEQIVTHGYYFFDIF